VQERKRFDAKGGWVRKACPWEKDGRSWGKGFLLGPVGNREFVNKKRGGSGSKDAVQRANRVIGRRKISSIFRSRLQGWGGRKRVTSLRRGEH